MTAPRARVLVMCGLPASGKTTTAARLHAAAGGRLIRSCDVYRALGISLPAWVERTRGFTERVREYERMRDRAYQEMARLLDGRLTAGAALVIVDAVHGERDKRAVVYDICLRHEATPILVLCACEDWAEIQRRFAARRGRETQPEHEASDLAVYRDIHRRWQDPGDDRMPDGAVPMMLRYDTFRGRLTAEGERDPWALTLARRALVHVDAGCSKPVADARRSS